MTSTFYINGKIGGLFPDLKGDAQSGTQGKLRHLLTTVENCLKNAFYGGGRVACKWEVQPQLESPQSQLESHCHAAARVTTGPRWSLGTARVFSTLEAGSHPAGRQLGILVTRFLVLSFLTGAHQSLCSLACLGYRAITGRQGSSAAPFLSLGFRDQMN